MGSGPALPQPHRVGVISYQRGGTVARRRGRVAETGTHRLPTNTNVLNFYTRSYTKESKINNCPKLGSEKINF